MIRPTSVIGLSAVISNVLYFPQRRPAAAMPALWPWLEQASKRLVHRNLLAIALANKLARIAWAVLAKGRGFAAQRMSDAASQPT